MIRERIATWRIEAGIHKNLRNGRCDLRQNRSPLLLTKVNTEFPDRPKLLADPKALEARLKQTHDSHIAPLTHFVDNLRADRGPDAAIPYFDPWDGGVEAELLLLLEAPGPKALRTGFVSRDNPDETAKNLFEATNMAGLERQRTVIWNVVPWYIGNGKTIRQANTADINQGARDLRDLIELLPELRAVVMLGKKAQRAETLLKEMLPALALFECPHPSPMFVNRAPENWEILLNRLRNVGHFLKSSARW